MCTHRYRIIFQHTMHRDKPADPEKQDTSLRFVPNSNTQRSSGSTHSRDRPIDVIQKHGSLKDEDFVEKFKLVSDVHR